VALFGGIELLTLLQSGRGSLGTIAHLGGLLFGWIFMKSPGWAARAGEHARTRRVMAERKSAARLEDERRRIQEEVDGLLDKISREGMGSLTAEERKRLVEASEKLRRL